MSTESRLVWTEELVRGEKRGRESRQVFKEVCGE